MKFLHEPRDRNTEIKALYDAVLMLIKSRHGGNTEVTYEEIDV